MSYRVHTDGTIEVDSLEEALALQERIRQRAARPSLAELNSDAHKFTPISQRDTATYDHILTILKRLEPHSGRSVGSDILKEVLETESPNGVGPRLRKIRSELEQHGLNLDKILVPQRQNDGVTKWMVQVPEKS